MSAGAIAMDNAFAVRAHRLLDLWSGLSVRHVALGSACACCTGAVALRLDDFELDIVDYLDDAGRRSGIPEVAAFFDELNCGRRPMQPGPQGRPLVRMLERVEQGDVAEAVAAWLMPRLERTLESFAREHGPRRAG